MRDAPKIGTKPLPHAGLNQLLLRLANRKEIEKNSFSPSPDISPSSRNRNHTLCQIFFRIHGCSGYPG